jgi:hypothetical protein
MKSVGIVNEFNYFKFFWENFGISPRDIDQYDPNWLRLMAICGSQENKVQADRMRQKTKGK